MIESIIPQPIRIWLRTKIKETVLGGTNLPVTTMKYIPYEKGSSCYVLPKEPDDNTAVCSSGLPIPPRDLWLGYGNSQEEFLSSGEEHVSKMLEILKRSGFSFAAGKRVLDFGCGAGRMIRQLLALTESCEIWGSDIDSEMIYWCKQYLEPPFHFLTTTTIPHLPFKDGYFDFIYAGSVFTHIDDLSDAWLLELRRILSKEGRLYLTIHDNHTMELLDTAYRHTWLAKVIYSNDFYKTAKQKGGKIVIGRDSHSQVFYDIDYFRRSVQFLFELISITPEAYGYQTGIQLKHKSISEQKA